MTKLVLLGPLSLLAATFPVACIAKIPPAPNAPFLTPLPKEDTSFGAGCYAYDKKRRTFFAEEIGDDPPRIRVRGVRVIFPPTESIDADGQVSYRVGAWNERVLQKGVTTVRFRVLSEKTVGWDNQSEIIMTVTHDGKTDRRRLRMSCGS